MDRRRFLRTTGAIATGTVATLAGCSGGDGGGGGETTTADPAKTNTIRMVSGSSDYYFDPVGLFVEAGETVTWTVDSGAHSSTAYEKGNGPASVTRIPDGAKAWDSGTLSETGATFEHTFDTEGTYDYFCVPHKSLGMVGRIVVGEPGGPAEGSMPPDGSVPESATIVEEEAVSHDEFSG
ncbi:MAG: plastocyanin/azurin family copper-binding protein [Haloarculaceae archaeon]